MMTFDQFLANRLAGGGFSTEDTLAGFLPLLKQTAEAQQQRKIAPLKGAAALQVIGGRLYFPDAKLADPIENPEALARVDGKAHLAVDVVAEVKTEFTATQAQAKASNLWIGAANATITHPVYLPGYISWEHEVGHHDSLTDAFCLGMILASLACGLNFHRPEDLEEFVAHRGNLFARWPSLHPVIAKVIFRLTELKRKDRPHDLSALLVSLENYREQDGGFDMDLARAEAGAGPDPAGKRQTVLATLQKRLFEISRRNRLLHFRSTMQSVNLTWASVPLSQQVENIRASEIFAWDDKLRKQIVSGKAIPLDRYLRFEEAIYLPTVLDRIRREARRDAAEYGFAQLRLVLGFLRWSNLKTTPPERFDSPLILLPVELVREKGVRDRYVLKPLATAGEINPVIRHYFQQLYGLQLPAEIDLAEQDLSDFHAALSQAIQSSEAGVELALIDRPRIRVIHAHAKRRLDSYRRRARLVGPGVREKEGLEYSYDPENFQPLGQRLFETHLLPIEISTDHFEWDHDTIWPRARSNDDREENPSIQVHQLVGDEQQNPYRWELDLCSLTLGNFRYRKMSLVRDYDEMQSDETPHPPFDAVFSLQPKPRMEALPPVPREQDFSVLPCDPTQASAIAQAQNGQSYIIQGPPGTGKSQTITNLIADFVARRKRVLFVCEKRAAIDVVHHRLKQIGLASLCSLIHDSQADKKAFVMDLKDTYETLQQSAAAENSRDGTLAEWKRECDALTRFAGLMSASSAIAGVTVSELLSRAVDLRDDRPDLTPAECEQLPHYADWVANHEAVEAFLSRLADIQPDGLLASHPFRYLNNSLAEEPQPIQAISEFLEAALTRCRQVATFLQTANVREDELKSWPDVLALFRHLSALADLARHRLLDLLHEHSERSQEWTRELAKHRQLRNELEQAREHTTHWREKLSPPELAVALDQARQFNEKGFLAWFRPAWWRLRKVLYRRYDFKAQPLQPTWLHVLERLDQEYQRQSACESHLAVMQSTFHFAGDASAFDDQLAHLRKSHFDQPAYVKAAVDQAAKELESQKAIVELIEQAPLVQELNDDLQARLVLFEGLAPAELRDVLQSIRNQVDLVPDFVYGLKSLAKLSLGLQTAFRTFPLNARQVEAAITAQTLERIGRENPDFKRFDARDRSRHVERLDAAHRKLQQVNANFVRQTAGDQFREHLAIAGQSDSQLTDKQKEFKKQYNRGRKILEHEFGKQMRHKPIRELATGESGLVVRDLKPIWLMSPLSVADTLPMDPGFFDVIIFDEASQITLEEAMPSVFRANQIIVVGDEMQLPPTSFFTSKTVDDEDALWMEDKDGESVTYDLDGNSFLTHAAKNLPSTMLGWHYRSRSESLISFSNAAFYEGRLLTVPEETLATATGEIRVTDVEQGTAHIEELLNRAVSFHQMETGCYENRRNTPEAEYIAHLIRGLLLGDSGLTAGIVAFSEAQQDEIEQALKRLADADPKFADRLEAEWEREDEGQFAGLLVKNLENIQGDERDVIILSVCYGPNAEGRMRMNFGPINQSGGEKRLNVAFSRSKHHMAVVSSIRHEAITNDYNTGARALKNYLHYAEAQSSGKIETAQRILEELSHGRTGDVSREERAPHPVLVQIQEELERRGYRVDQNVGQSQFRCHLAVYCQDDAMYRLGILVDTDEWYRQAETLEREVLRPKLLEAFGWRIAHVLVKDWQANPALVLETLEAQLQTPGSSNA